MEDDMRIFDIMNGLNDETSDRAGFIYRSAADMLATVADGNGNVNVSPVSLWLALALAAQGAYGHTLEQLEEALGINGLCADQYRILIESINQRWLGASSVMSVHDSVWIGDTLTPHASAVA